jgi:hypothetical protein
MPALSESLLFTPATSVGTTATTAVVYPNNTATTQVYVSVKTKGDGYFGASDGLHTAMYVATTDFWGTITMQATLATDPVESDWFAIDDTTVTYTQNDDRNTSTVDMRNFTGNFVWIRGKVVIDNGAVSYIQYNH